MGRQSLKVQSFAKRRRTFCVGMEYMKITGFYIVKDKDYHNLLDTFPYYSNIDIVNFLTKLWGSEAVATL